MMPNVRELIEKAKANGCDAPNCNHQHESEGLILYARCHASSKVIARVDTALGALLICCARCGQPVVTVTP